MNNNSTHIFTRSRKFIDTRVWLVLMSVGIVSLGLLAYKAADTVSCEAFSIVSDGYTAGKAGTYYVGEKIAFKTSSKSGSVKWDFGDHTKGDGAEVIHQFEHEGNFMVTATVNGKCEEAIRVSIIEMRMPVTLNTSIANPISGPDAIHAQEAANFLASAQASSYEWTVLNSPDFPIQTTQTATYTFLSPGTRIIELKIDNDPKKVFRKNIQVLPALVVVEQTPAVNEMTQPVVPPPMPKEEATAEPEKPKTVVIPNEEFVNLFNQVTEGKKDLQSFNQYLCNGEKTKVLANGTDWETMVSFYQKINERKKYDIKSVEAVRDPETNCVTILKVKYKKRTLGIF